MGVPKSEMVPGTVRKSDPKLGILKPKSNSPNDHSAIVKFVLMNWMMH